MKKLIFILFILCVAGCEYDDESVEDVEHVIEDVIDMVKDDNNTDKEAISLATDVIDLVAIHDKKEEKKDGS